MQIYLKTEYTNYHEIRQSNKTLITLLFTKQRGVIRVLSLCISIIP